mmetsp:Transcript_22826/g.63780  ORF Transcript_22826/g.63780 Transcript_22826/m.63780 type:complete len:247 (+) Transcript_22826:82-822(+)
MHGQPRGDLPAAMQAPPLRVLRCARSLLSVLPRRNLRAATRIVEPGSEPLRRTPRACHPPGAAWRSGPAPHRGAAEAFRANRACVEARPPWADADRVVIRSGLRAIGPFLQPVGERRRPGLSIPRPRASAGIRRLLRHAAERRGRRRGPQGRPCVGAAVAVRARELYERGLRCGFREVAIAAGLGPRGVQWFATIAPGARRDALPCPSPPFSAGLSASDRRRACVVTTLVRGVARPRPFGLRGTQR